jgi:hypothetical protein
VAFFLAITVAVPARRWCRREAVIVEMEERALDKPNKHSQQSQLRDGCLLGGGGGEPWGL